MESKVDSLGTQGVSCRQLHSSTIRSLLLLELPLLLPRSLQLLSVAATLMKYALITVLYLLALTQLHLCLSGE